MSALEIILLVAMVVPANAPEPVSGEMEQGLDLSGEWEAVGLFEGASVEVRLRDGKLQLLALPCGAGQMGQNRRVELPLRVNDEGNGNLRINSIIRGRCHSLGIYRQQGDKVFLGYREAEKGRPTEFQAGKEQEALILKRIKYRK